MFCPKCGEYLKEADLLQRNVKYAMGNIPVEYDARCPSCTEEIGHMSWGRFTVNPQLAGTRYRDGEPEQAPDPLIPPPPELRTVLRPRKNPNRPEPAPISPESPDLSDEPVPSTRLCPHCGQPWPEE